MKSTTELTILLIAAVIFGIVAIAMLADYVQGQTLANVSTIQTSGTPVVQTTQAIATEEDLGQQFNTFATGLLGTLGASAGGIGALWARFRSKAKRIDNALRGQDFDQRDLMEVLNSFFEAAKKDKTKTPGQLLDEMAYKDKVLLEKTIAVAWANEYDEYMEWFHQRYEVNPT